MNEQKKTAGKTAKQTKVTMNNINAEVVINQTKRSIVPIAKEMPRGMILLRTITERHGYSIKKHSDWVCSERFKNFVRNYQEHVGGRLEDIICNVICSISRDNSGLYACPEIARRYERYLQGDNNWGRLDIPQSQPTVEANHVDAALVVPAHVDTEEKSKANTSSPSASTTENDLSLMLAYLTLVYGPDNLVGAVEDLEFCYESTTKRIGSSDKPVRRLLEVLKTTFQGMTIKAAYTEKIA